jgi:hypothetical protein
MGHIPLFSFKKDKISMHDIDKKKLEYRGLIAKLYDILVDNNIIYLCADTHNFSIMKIEHKGKVLIQITAGTGGADPDLITGEFVKKPTIVSDNEYTITAYALNSYGYVRIEILGKHINVSYKQIITSKKERAYATGDRRMRPLSAPSNILDLKQNKASPPPLLRQGSLPTGTPTMISRLRIINYQLPRIANAARNVIFVSDIIEKTTIVNSKYKSEDICRNIETNPNGNVVSEVKKDLFCYKKDANKGKQGKTIKTAAIKTI